jgi:hypothetical protein
MGAFTFRVEEVLEHLFNESMDPDDYVQEYETLNFNGVTYGRMPVVPDYEPLGLAFYPIFNESYRKILNGKLINSYYFREIGQETIEMWAQRFAAKMDEIMPFFNQLYETTLIEYSALDTMRIHSVGQNHVEGTENTTASTASDTTSNSTADIVNSNFPQTSLSPTGDYATSGNATKADSTVDVDATNESEANSTQDVNSDTLVTGYQGAASDLITKFRNSIINIDTMVIAEVEDLFMLVLDSGDEYFGREDFYWR